MTKTLVLRNLQFYPVGGGWSILANFYNYLFKFSFIFMSISLF
jgi:hypothetical protein